LTVDVRQFYTVTGILHKIQQLGVRWSDADSDSIRDIKEKLKKVREFAPQRRETE